MLWSGIDPGRAGVSLEWFGRAVSLNHAPSRKCSSETLAATGLAVSKIYGTVKHVAHRELL